MVEEITIAEALLLQTLMSLAQQAQYALESFKKQLAVRYEISDSDGLDLSTGRVVRQSGPRTDRDLAGTLPASSNGVAP